MKEMRVKKKSSAVKYLVLTMLISGVLITIYFFSESKDVFYKISNFPTRGQQMTNWCWAASMQMVAEFIKKDSANHTQSIIVQEYLDSIESNSHLNTSLFCNDSVRNENNGNIPLQDPSFISSYFKNKSITSIRREFIDYNKQKDAFWEVIKENLYDNSPIIFNNVKWQNNSSFWDGHTIVCSGFVEIDTLRLLYVQDPWRPLCKGCSYYLSYDALASTIVSDSSDSIQGDEVFYAFGYGEKTLLRKLRKMWRKLKSSFNNASEEVTIEGKNLDLDDLRQNTSVSVITINNLNVGVVGYLIQEVRNGQIVESYTIRPSKNSSGFYLDSYNMKCLIYEAINPNEISNIWLEISPDNNPINVTFNFNKTNYSANIEDFNRIVKDPSVNIKLARNVIL
jgi:hypothetical protein